LQNRRYKAVAAAGHIGHIPRSALPIAEYLPERCDVESQASFIDGHARPNLIEQVLLGDGFTGPSGQRNQNIEGAAAYADRHAVLRQKPLARRQAERTKLNLTRRHNYYRTAQNDKFPDLCAIWTRDSMRASVALLRVETTLAAQP
jgi:hypothetical protein